MNRPGTEFEKREAVKRTEGKVNGNNGEKYFLLQGKLSDCTFQTLLFFEICKGLFRVFPFLKSFSCSVPDSWCALLPLSLTATARSRISFRYHINGNRRTTWHRETVV